MLFTSCLPVFSSIEETSSFLLFCFGQLEDRGGREKIKSRKRKRKQKTKHTVLWSSLCVLPHKHNNEGGRISLGFFSPPRIFHSLLGSRRSAETMAIFSHPLSLPQENRYIQVHSERYAKHAVS